MTTTLVCLECGYEKTVDQYIGVMLCGNCDSEQWLVPKDEE